MNARTCVVQAKAQPVLGLFLGVCLAVLSSSFVSTNAWAQFDKTAWPANVATPKIEAVDLQGKAWNAAELAGKVVVLNFWATWCPPCIEELPLIDAFYKQNQSKSFQVVGLAVDQPSQVKRFLTQKPLQFPNGLAGLNGTQLGVSLGNAESVLPFSVLFDAKGKLLAQKAGKLEQKDLDSWLQKVL